MKPAGKCVSEKDIDAEITRRAKAIRADIVREALLQTQKIRDRQRKISERSFPSLLFEKRKSSALKVASQKVLSALSLIKAKVFPSAQDKLDRLQIEQENIEDFCQACQDLLQEYDTERVRFEGRLLLANREVQNLQRRRKAGAGRNHAGAVLLKRKRSDLALLRKAYDEWMSKNADRLALLQERLIYYDDQLASALNNSSKAKAQHQSRTAKLLYAEGLVALSRATYEIGVIDRIEKRIVEKEKLADVVFSQIELNPKIFTRLENQVNEREKHSSEIIDALAALPPVEVESFSVDELKNMYSQLQMACESIQSVRIEQIRARDEAFELFLKAQKYVIVWDERRVVAQQYGNDFLSKQAEHRLDGAKKFVEEFRDRLRQMRAASKPTIDLQKKIGKSSDVIRRRLAALGKTLPGERPEENPEGAEALSQDNKEDSQVE